MPAGSWHIKYPHMLSSESQGSCDCIDAFQDTISANNQRLFFRKTKQEINSKKKHGNFLNHIAAPQQFNLP